MATDAKVTTLIENGASIVAAWAIKDDLTALVLVPESGC